MHCLFYNNLLTLVEIPSPLGALDKGHTGGGQTYRHTYKQTYRAVYRVSLQLKISLNRIKYFDLSVYIDHKSIKNIILDPTLPGPLLSPGVWKYFNI